MFANDFASGADEHRGYSGLSHGGVSFCHVVKGFFVLLRFGTHATWYPVLVRL